MSGKTGPGRGVADDVFILDIDGTLMHTHEIDNRCYWQAIGEVFGVEGRAESLQDYVNVSDSGILLEWCRRRLGRAPADDEVGEIRSRFLTLLERFAEDRPDLFQPRAGLEAWLEFMSGRPHAALAIATGSWGNTAAFKLEVSGLARFGLALASADDAVRRTDIMLAALRRLGIGPGAGGPAVTYVGDAPWDYRASRELGWSFIGIAAGARARALQKAGARRVEPDFRGLARHAGTWPV